EQAITQVLLAFGFVIALDAAARDHLGGQRGDSAAPPVLRGSSEDHAQVGVSSGDRAREPEAEFVAAAVAENDARMLLTVAIDRAIKIADDYAMSIVRHVGHLEHSPGQLVAVPVQLLGLPELLEGHHAAMVGRADA